MDAKSTTLCLALAISVGCSAAMADDVVSIGNETALYRAKAKREEARRDYEKTSVEADRYAGGAESSLPTVNWVEGLAGNVRAQLQTESGSVREVRVGQVIDGRGSRIVAIKGNDVLVKRDGRTYQLALTPASTQLNNGMTGMPSAPGIPVPVPGIR